MKKLMIVLLTLLGTEAFSQELIGNWLADISIAGSNYTLTLSLNEDLIYYSGNIAIFKNGQTITKFHVSNIRVGREKWYHEIDSHGEFSAQLVSTISVDKNYPFDEGTAKAKCSQDVITMKWKMKNKKLEDLDISFRREPEAESRRREAEKQNQIENAIIENVKNIDVFSFLSSIESLGGNDRQKKENAQRYYYLFRRLELNPQNVNKMMFRTQKSSVSSFWKADVIGEIASIGREQNGKLINIVITKIQNNDVAYLEKMNREGFYFSDLSIADLQKAQEFCGTCAYITTALNRHLEAQKRAEEAEERELARIRASYNSSSRSFDNSSSGNSDDVNSTYENMTVKVKEYSEWEKNANYDEWYQEIEYEDETNKVYKSNTGVYFIKMTVWTSQGYLTYNDAVLAAYLYKKYDYILKRNQK